MMIKKLFPLALLVLCGSYATAQRYAYTTVASDPMKTRIYTLQNGLTIYLSDNAEQPRIQTFIAVRAGGKNDPHESTGLAHYLEHLMFKGTSRFGTQDYAAERPILDQIEQQYEVYGHTTDTLKRRAIYHVIDSLSYQASTHAIANEYDKLMTGIGSDKSNAYTDVDVTCYTEDIPANEVSRWAEIQSDRFEDMVIRGFHTELEAVYEEYNISLTNDFEKVDEATSQALFPHHPYGMQTVIGTQEHLKNPSLQNVKNYYHTWYVPNNVAICMSGDLGGNPDSIVAIIDQYFGSWKPNQQLPQLSFPAETALTQPIYKEVKGREQEMVSLAWRMPKVSDSDYDKLLVVKKLLSNGKAGLFDLDLNQTQRVMSTQVFARGMADYSSLFAFGLPKEGQTLEEVRNLILGEIEKLKKGDFQEDMLRAIVNNMKLEKMHEQEDNEQRANQMVQAFINRVDWKDAVEQTERISRLTKQDIVDFANRWLTQGYVCVNKLQGEDPNEKKIDKPVISPIEMNRGKQSEFVTHILDEKVKDIAPRFVDFDKDLTKSTLKNGTTVLYKHNDNNGIFSLEYIIERGSKQDKMLDVASSYMSYLGTDKLSAEQLQQQLYQLACDADISVGECRTNIRISGLAENMKDAMRLTEEWINTNKAAEKEVLENLVSDIQKAREDSKLEQRNNFMHLVAYGEFGKDNVMTHDLSNDELKTVKAQQLLDAIHSLQQYQQTITYYGPMSEKDFIKTLSMHKMPKQAIAPEQDNHFKMQTVTKPEVLLAPYDAKNIYMMGYSNNGQTYDPKEQAHIDFFNEYFGGGMNTIVFQELRESRGLAYSASAYYQTPMWKGDANEFHTQIITQNDKMSDCIDVFHQITEDMPLAEGAFRLAKDAILKRMATQRITRGQVLDYYLMMQDLGIKENPEPQIYNEIQRMSLNDLADFQKKNVRGRTYRYLILGDEKELDMKKLESLGTLKRVSTTEIFGY